MSKILIIDDEPSVLAAFRQLLTAEGHQILTSSTADAAFPGLREQAPDLVILDICMPGMNGLDALREIKRGHEKLPVIVMTGRGTMQTAIEATQRGAFDYHIKPFDPEGMLRTIDDALQGSRLMQRHVAIAPESQGATTDAIVGQSAAMQQLFKMIGRVAATDATILIRGESGTGKELVARAIYQHSLRASAPMLVMNCAAIPETLLESELFGSEQGAFTGATRRRIGRFEQADAGTLFLDEIGDVSLGIQARVLRVLQGKTFERLGSNETLHSDVRVLAATNRDLEGLMAEKLFREDLYHRLNVVAIHLPPLRERREDIPLLVDYFLDRFSRDLKIEKPLLSQAALDVLDHYAWPGNVRELEHCIHRACILARGSSIQPSDLSLGPRHSDRSQEVGSARHWNDRLVGLIDEYLDDYEGPQAHSNLVELVDRLLIEAALQRTRGNRSHAARFLGISRPTLHCKIQKYGLPPSDAAE